MDLIELISAGCVLAILAIVAAALSAKEPRDGDLWWIGDHGPN